MISTPHAPTRSIDIRGFSLSLSVSLTAAFCLSLAACGGGGTDDPSAAAQSADSADGTASIQAAAAPKRAASPALSTAAATGSTTTTATKLVNAAAANAAAAAAKTAAPVTAVGYTPVSVNTLQVGLKLPGFPHSFDVYQPPGATKVIVFLHPHGGYSWQVAYDLGLNSNMAPPTSATVNWAWLNKNGIIAIFPQATAPAGTTQPIWSDYIQKSGQDDVGFLKAVSTFAKTNLGASEVSISGHSDGGAMTARMWCEATTSFKSFVSLAGPMPSTTWPKPAPTCTPLSKAPYYVVIGSADTTLDTFAAGAPAPSTQQVNAGLVNRILVAEWNRHHDRSSKVCGDNPTLTPAAIAASGPTWNNCSTNVRYTIVNGANHPIASLEQFAGMRMIDLIRGFVN